MGKDIKKILGKRIRELRIKKNMTQQALGDLTEMSRSKISYIESGGVSIGIEVLHRLTEALNCEIIIKEIE